MNPSKVRHVKRKGEPQEKVGSLKGMEGIAWSSNRLL